MTTTTTPGGARGEGRSAAPSGTVWDDLVGQRPLIEGLRRAAGGDGMTHAWLFTGPPGSGRSNAALAFAAALQCEQGTGCGACQGCRTVLQRSHPDVTVVRSETSVLYKKDIKELVLRSALTPSLGRWQIILVEDADRLGDPDAAQGTGNSLLKAIEEPTSRTVWLLCAPTPRDVLQTIRSRCRQVTLSTPSAHDVADFLVRREGVDEARAAFAARASQGHIGRARALALHEETLTRRREVVQMPTRLETIGDCMRMASNLAALAKDETEAITAETEKAELDELQVVFGSERKDTTSRAYRAALGELEKLQKQKAKRRVLDVVDRCLMDLVSVYRDAIALSVGAPGALVNEELRGEVATLSRAASPEQLLRMIDAVFEAREQMLEFNVPVQLALESMMVALRLPGGAGR